MSDEYKKFRVDFSREQYGDMVVVAKDREEAKEKAIAKKEITWEDRYGDPQFLEVEELERA